jgi:hypothetical protein
MCFVAENDITKIDWCAVTELDCAGNLRRAAATGNENNE